MTSENLENDIEVLRSDLTDSSDPRLVKISLEASTILRDADKTAKQGNPNAQKQMASEIEVWLTDAQNLISGPFIPVDHLLG